MDENILSKLKEFVFVFLLSITFFTIPDIVLFISLIPLFVIDEAEDINFLFLITIIFLYKPINWGQIA